MRKHYQLIILGSGPAGCSAAIYAARANLQVAMLTGSEIGGQLTRAAKVANWPGEREVAGAELMERMLTQVQALPVDVLYDSAVKIDLIGQVSTPESTSGHPFLVAGQHAQYSCDALIIALGSHPRLLGLANEESYLGHGLSTCATCDGFFYRGKEVAVVGGGNSMASAALYLASIAKMVHIIHRSNQFRAEAVELARLRQLPNVKFYPFTTVEEYLGAAQVEQDKGLKSGDAADEWRLGGLGLRDVRTGECQKLAVDGCFLNIGHIPSTNLFAQQLALEGRSVCTGFAGVSTQCSVSGVFAAGDLVYGVPKQAIVAAGWGCTAALDAAQYLQKNSTWEEVG